MAASSFEVESALESRQNWVYQAFPGFRFKSVTFVMSVIQVGFYIISLIMSLDFIGPSDCALYKLGGNHLPSIIENKQFYRLILPILLHGGLAHLLVNVFSQLRLSFTIERYYSTKKFIAIYFLSGIGGNLLSCYFKPQDLLVGASTSLFGIFGAYGCYFLYNWNSFPPGRNLNLMLYLFFVLISLEIPITLQSIDIAGHVGGFIVGVLLGFFLLPRQESSENWNYILIINGIILLCYFAAMIWLLSFIEITNFSPIC